MSDAGFFPVDPDEDLCPCDRCREVDCDPDDARGRAAEEDSGNDR